MFVEEARLAGMIRHPNVVSVLDVGEDTSGPFLVMDYVEGVPSYALIQHASKRGEPIPLQVCLRIIMEAAEGLHAAHELRNEQGDALGLVHRDVSPQNLLVGFDGVTRVTDFGVAKAFGRTTRTATGVLKGKFGYMAPEQLRFEEPDRRSDLFSLGIVLYELVVGTRLYKNRDGTDGIRRILHEPPPDLGEHREDVPPELVALVFAMLAKEPDHRPPDLRTVARRLEAILSDLVAEEGRVEVGSYLNDVFAERRHQWQEHVSNAVAHPARAAQNSQEFDIDLESTAAAAQQTRTSSSRKRRRTQIAAAAVGGALAVAAAGLAVWQAGILRAAPASPRDHASTRSAESRSDPDAESTGDDSSSGPEEGDPAEQTNAKQARTETSAQDEGTQPEASEPAESGTTREARATQDRRERDRAEAERRRRRRQEARRAKRQRRGSKGKDFPMWDWQ
jgi:serine/threonine protein kinase